MKLYRCSCNKLSEPGHHDYDQKQPTRTRVRTRDGIFWLCDPCLKCHKIIEPSGKDIIKFGRTTLVGKVEIIKRSNLSVATRQNIEELEKHGYKFKTIKRMNEEDMFHPNIFAFGTTPDKKPTVYVVRYTTSGASGMTFLYTKGQSRQQVNKMAEMEKLEEERLMSSQERHLRFNIKQAFLLGNKIIPVENYDYDPFFMEGCTRIKATPEKIKQVLKEIIEGRCPHRVTPMKNCVKCIVALKLI